MAKECGCKPCSKGVPMWMATFSDMAILLMAFFVLLIAFNDTEDPGAQMITGRFSEQAGVQNAVPVVARPKGDNVLAIGFTPASVDESLARTVVEVTTDIRPDKETVLTRLNKTKIYKRNSDAEVVQASLAKEIATGKVRIVAGKYKTIIEVPTQNISGSFAVGDLSRKGFEVREEDMELYAKVALLQAETEKELEIRYVDDKDAYISEQFEFLRQSLVSEINMGQAEVIKEDDRIIIRLVEQGSFSSGRADLKPRFKRLLTGLGSTLEDVAGFITVEGHTDTTPMAFNGRFRNNFDLSAARSSAVVDFLIGVSPAVKGQIMASGMGGVKPLMSNDTSVGRSRNRRIEIIVSAPV